MKSLRDLINTDNILCLLKLKLQYFGHPMQRANSLDPDAGKDWRQKKMAAKDEMVREHPWLNGQESEWTPGDTGGQRSLACCSPWGSKESDGT